MAHGGQRPVLELPRACRPGWRRLPPLVACPVAGRGGWRRSALRRRRDAAVAVGRLHASVTHPGRAPAGLPRVLPDRAPGTQGATRFTTGWHGPVTEGFTVPLSSPGRMRE